MNSMNYWIGSYIIITQIWFFCCVKWAIPSNILRGVQFFVCYCVMIITLNTHCLVFSSHIFLFYFLPTFLLVYFLVPARGRNIVLLLASIVFYAWGAPDFILILLASTVANFYIVRQMHRVERQSAKRLWCALAITICLGLLAYFKYANFFVENVNALLEAFGLGTMAWTKVLLPIGISFFSFQSVTYVVDVYRGINKPMERLDRKSVV